MKELEQQLAEERLMNQAISAELKDAKLELLKERNARQILQNDTQNLRDQKISKRRPKGDPFFPEKETKGRPIFGKKETYIIFFVTSRR